MWANYIKTKFIRAVSVLKYRMKGSHLYAHVNLSDFASVVVMPSTAKIFAKMRAARAARLFFHFLTNDILVLWRSRCRSRSRSRRRLIGESLRNDDATKQ